MITEPKSCIAFAGSRRVAHGAFPDVALQIRDFLDAHVDELVVIFDDETSERIELDLRGTDDEIRSRYAAHEPVDAPLTGPGRPKLGVVAREVTLLPRHWEWLNQQPGGASVVLRKLVEDAKRASVDKDRTRTAQERTYKFISAVAGDFAGFEEATRALFAGERARFLELIAPWPVDIREHASALSTSAFDQS
jgi:hypothetical protein